MSDITFREITGGSLLMVVVIALSLNFAGSVFNQYGVNPDSKTLKKVKKKTEVHSPQVSNLSNESENINVESGNFLSPQGFQIVSGAFSSITSIPTVAQAAINELGFPPVLAALAGLIVIAGIWEIITLLFGVRT